MEKHKNSELDIKKQKLRHCFSTQVESATRKKYLIIFYIFPFYILWQKIALFDRNSIGLENIHFYIILFYSLGNIVSIPLILHTALYFYGERNGKLYNFTAALHHHSLFILSLWVYIPF